MRLRPNVLCQVTPLDGWDEYGQEKFGERYAELCAIVKLEQFTAQTSVRTDSSASRAYAHEFNAQSRLLFGNKSALKIGDKVDVSGVALRVIGVFPRHDLGGNLDHYQVDLTIWGNG